MRTRAMLYELEGSEVFLAKGQRFTDLQVTINYYTWGLGGVLAVFSYEG
jgi:hypothetical protein